VAESPVQLQRAHYAATAQSYDREFVDSEDPHGIALRYMTMLMQGFDCRSVLDVGTGTGRGVRHFLAAAGGMDVRGVEPVQAMIEVAESEHGVPAGCIVQGEGEALPFSDGQFDAVCELGVLHHVPDPNRVVAEMLRVARRAVFISDENRFGRGRPSARAVKYLLHHAGAWNAVWKVRTRGRGYHWSPDGVSYSYSVYDSLDVVRAWADRIIVVPTGPAPVGSADPHFDAPHVLLCALRETA
jgi:SAM-dependent methyltransferase